MESETAAAAAAASSSSSPSSSAAAEASCCPICLDPLTDHAYLDRCFHAFCFKCITKWVKFAAAKHPRPLSSIRCPLCKVENLSIIHGFSGGSFRRRYVNQDQRNRCLSGVHELRSHVYDREGEIANNIFDVQRYWKSRKYLRQNTWLQNWLRREIQTITQEEDADVIVHHIQGVVESFMARQEEESLKGTPEQKRQEFRRLIFGAAGPFLLARTKRFVDELELFLASGLNIDAYDRVYMQRLSMSSLRDTREIDEESSDQSVRSRFLYFLNEDDADTAD